MYVLEYFVILYTFYLSYGVGLEVCPKQCDCDIDNGLNRAICSDQNIIGVAVGVPKEVQVYSLSHNVISELDNYCFKAIVFSCRRSGLRPLRIHRYNNTTVVRIGEWASGKSSCWSLNQLKAFDLAKLLYLILNTPDTLLYLHWETLIKFASTDNPTPEELGYTAIQALTLSNNLIFWIGLHAFAGLDKLVHLDLSNNRLRYIPSDLFWDNPVLDVLDLSSNVFESLKNEPFLMHSKLQVLNLNNCRMKTLPDRIFTRLPNLKKLDISDNYMVTLSISTLSPLQKLDRVEIRNEYLQCNPDFITLENWLASNGITYKKQCQKKLLNMSEKIIAIEQPPKQDVDIAKVWNVTTVDNTTIPVKPSKPLSPLQKLDKDFSAIQAFVIGLEVGLAIGIVGTYVWLRRFCDCGQLNCTRPQTRRQRRRVRRIADGDMRTNLLWSNIVNPELATPPVFRRQLSLPDRSPPFPVYGLPGVGDAALPMDMSRVEDRSETPPPPYHECRLTIQ